MSNYNDDPDPIVAEVRRVRDELARKFNYDVHAICEDLRRRQGKTVTIEELRAGASVVKTFEKYGIL